MKKEKETKRKSFLEIEDLRIRLEEAEETLSAIRRGEVDGLVVSRPEGDQVFTLKGAERSYRVFVEAMNEGAVTLSFDGTILYCNNRFAQMVETPHQKIIGDSIYQFISSRGAFEPAFQKGKTVSSKTEIPLRKNNDLVPVALSFNPMLEDQVPGVCMVVTDLTELARYRNHLEELVKERTEQLEAANAQLRVEIAERKGAEEQVQGLLNAVRYERDNLSALVNSIPDEIWFSDTEEKFTLANPSALLEFGVSFTGGIDIRQFAETLQVYRPDGSPRPIEEAPPLRALQGEVVRNQEEIIRTPSSGDLRYRQVNSTPVRDATGKIIGSISVVRDITELKRAEETLRQSEARRKVAEAIEAERKRLYDVLETLPAMICLLTRDYHVAFANRSFREKFGESGGRCCYEYCFGRTEPCEFCESYRVLETGKPHHWEVTAPNGTGIIDAYDFPFTDVNGSAMILEMDIDITERRQAEEALRESERRLRNLSGQLLIAQEQERKKLAGELHDSIAATLGAIKLSIENTLGQMEQHSPAWESLNALISLTQQANEETRRIMADLRPSILDDLGVIAAVGWLCREFKKRYSHLQVDKQLALSEEVIPESLKTSIFRICQEALNNVGKHSGADLVQLSLTKAPNGIELTIKDTGQGFEPLETGSNREPGKKLGLTSMRERAGLSGGAFHLESAIGKGTLIRVSWPL